MKAAGDFFDTTSEKTDAELYRLVAHPDIYLPEAVQAARRELLRRNLPPDPPDEKTTVLPKTEGLHGPHEPLSWPMRVLILLFVFPALWLTPYYWLKGFKRKARESLICFACAATLWLILVLLWRVPQ